MDRESAKRQIRQEWRRIIPSLLEPAQKNVNKEQSYICVMCGHGAHGDGLTFNPSEAGGLHCFGCGWHGDIIDLYMLKTGESFNNALKALASELGIKIDETSVLDGRNSTPKRRKNERAVATYPETNHIDYTEYYKQCRARLKEPAAISYLESRGISIETAAEYGLGYDPVSDPASNPGGTGESIHPCPRIIIPTSKNHYVGRSIDRTTPQGFSKMNAKGSSPAYFNGNALYMDNVQEVFIVEGAFDALSLLEIGVDAVAINSTSNADSFIKDLERRMTHATLVICLDNDNRPGTATAVQKLRDGLTRLNISHITADICNDCKDPNEALVSDRKRFIDTVDAVRLKASAKPDNISDYIDNFMALDIERFKSECKTGFENLDEKCGGLHGGLYCLAAISSLGKTTFAAQMADQIAAGGTDVLFFSLEQSKLELVSKSIARKTAQANIQTAVTSLSIRKGYLPGQVLSAAQAYKTMVGNRISIIEGNFNCNISFIGDYIRRYMRRTNTKPVVFIDYLQILQGEPGQGKQTTKEIVDNTVTQLKRISREYNLTIIVISSVNRKNYESPIDFDSLKESGGIEYTCDVVWGLQLQCLNRSEFDKQNNIKERRQIIKEAKSATPRKIELVCLKNRYGRATYNCYFDYAPEYDLFLTGNESELDFIPDRKSKPGKRLKI